MHEPYDDDIPDDPYKFYFQFDTEWITKYIDEIVKKLSESGFEYKITNIEGFPYKSLPVNSYFSNTAEDSSSLYLGNNYWNEGVWKKKHFIQNKLQNEYVNHLQSNAGYFLRQPQYYKGLYEILN
jgi:hypothetical protein